MELVDQAMGNVTNQQIYDLLLEIRDNLADTNRSADELLVNMRILNQELEVGGRQLAEARHNRDLFIKAMDVEDIPIQR
ncbi:MAG: hypothetical protein QOH32_3427 [Bradyrhizobium sp.]|nr:hypothetical protein [Bradyrhizobium sp.]